MSVYWYLLVMALTTYLIRMIPLAFFQKKITNPFIQSFLAYVPCACLTAMTFPAIIYATNTWISGIITFTMSVFLALKGKSLIVVSALSCVTAFLAEWVIRLIG